MLANYLLLVSIDSVGLFRMLMWTFFTYTQTQKNAPNNILTNM
jgi:hypothetical protein